MPALFQEADYAAAVTYPGTAQRGQGLAQVRHWSGLGYSELALWGECAGSGSKPYQVVIDRAGPAFKCSCPSRVFPCKHGAGLLALAIGNPEALVETSEPAWVEEWLSKRQARQEGKPEAKPKAASNIPASAEGPDPARLKRMAAGVAEQERWLIDAMRMGLAALNAQPAAAWEGRAAQLVDAQLPGLAATIRGLGASRGADRPAQLLARLGELYLLTQAFARLDALPDEAKAEVLQQVGVNLKREDLLLTQPSIEDHWLVLGQATAQEDRLTARRTWLYGRQTGRYALLLDYAFAGQGFATAFLPRRSYTGGLHFYPGLYPLRALVGEDFQLSAEEPRFPKGGSLDDALAAYAQALAANPLLRAFPMHLAGAVPERHKSAWHLRQADLLILLRCGDDTGWQMAAESGGQPLAVFGEWDGQALKTFSFHLQATPAA